MNQQTWRDIVDRNSRMNILSLVVNGLLALEFEWSDIENSLIANQNWRYPNSFLGKLSKVVFGQNCETVLVNLQK